jgi:ElaA protein
MKKIYSIKSFDDLEKLELYQILQLRSEVFVLEQDCKFQDIDNKDLNSYHLMCFVDVVLAGYARILPAGLSYSEISIGRVVTSPSFRGLGMGKEIMEKSISACENLFKDSTIRIGAQVYLSKFYNTLGFKEKGEPYDEDGILHVEMTRTLKL